MSGTMKRGVKLPIILVPNYPAHTLVRMNTTVRAICSAAGCEPCCHVCRRAIQDGQRFSFRQMGPREFTSAMVCEKHFRAKSVRWPKQEIIGSRMLGPIRSALRMALHQTSQLAKNVRPLK